MAQIMLSDEILQKLYSWIDEIPLSRPKRDIHRDFSDGCQFAEVVAFYFPKLVDLHNYTPSSSSNQKRANWNTLNYKVLKAFSWHIPRDTVERLISSENGTIENVLYTLRLKISAHQESALAQSEPQQPQQQKSPTFDDDDQAKHEDAAVVTKTQPIVQLIVTPSPQKPSKRPLTVEIDATLLLEKEIRIRELEEEVEELKLKLAKFEALCSVKDWKISQSNH